MVLRTRKNPQNDNFFYILHLSGQTSSMWGKLCMHFTAVLAKIFAAHEEYSPNMINKELSDSSFRKK